MQIRLPLSSIDYHRLPLPPRSSSICSRCFSASFSYANSAASLPPMSNLIMISGSFSNRASSNSLRAFSLKSQDIPPQHPTEIRPHEEPSGPKDVSVETQCLSSGACQLLPSLQLLLFIVKRLLLLHHMPVQELFNCVRAVV
ncbi:hypothetical protein CRG98_011949 [Punica granatum]|uniref:Uncharacterized protein n=1 Tax=Punica granatum TaxID=22663 RepID=A0A2I0KIW5_PUNGR|nr:hypothetical protein CRG98_011949 [Punica granatum]